MNKKDDIIRTTIELYHLKGETVSLDDIAKQVGCSKTLIIHYYGNRSNLLSACFCMICHEIRLEFDRVEAPEGVSKESMREYLTGLWRAYFSYLKDDPARAKFFIQYSHCHEQLPARYKTPEAIIRKILDERYEKAIESDEAMFFAVRYMVAIANGMASLTFSENRGIPDDVTDRCIGLIMNGVISECEREN